MRSTMMVVGDRCFSRHSRIGISHVVAWLSLALLPLASASLPGIPGVSPPNALFYVFAIMAIASMLLSGRFKKCWMEPGCYILIVLILWMLISSGFNGGESSLISNVITGVGAIVFYFVGMYLAYGTSPGWRWETAIFTGALVAAIVGLLHYVDVLPLFSFEKLGVAARTVGGFEFSNRGFKGLIDSSGSYDIWLLAGIMVSHRWMTRSSVRWEWRVLALVAAFVMIVADVVSQSRSGWLTIAVFLVVYWFGFLVLMERSPYRRKYFIAATLLLALAVVALLFISSIAQKTVEVLVNAQSATVFGRLGGYAQAMSEIGINPLFGAGKFWAMHNGQFYLVHNTPLSYAANNGIMAGIAFVLFYLYVLSRTFKDLIRSPVAEQRRNFLIFLAALLGSAVAINLFSGIGSKFFFALLGCISGSLLTYSRQKQIRSTAQRHTFGEQDSHSEPAERTTM